MSRNARIEEISDSDSDPDDMDPSDFANTIIRPSDLPPPTTNATQQLKPQFQAPSSTTADPEKYKRWQCLYPLYFDAARTRAEGRRVGKDLAVENPLAREIVDAVQLLGLNVVFEPGKMHPKDWANPGRVRILVKEDGRMKTSRVKNKHHLYLHVAKHLQAHPTTKDSPMRLRIAGMPLPEKPIPPPAPPRGWKIGTILPLHSPALSGGGVSENMFKEMMQEMQGGQSGQIDGAEHGAPNKKKEKEKKKKNKA